MSVNDHDFEMTNRSQSNDVRAAADNRQCRRSVLSQTTETTHISITVMQL